MYIFSNFYQFGEGLKIDCNSIVYKFESKNFQSLLNKGGSFVKFG